MKTWLIYCHLNKINSKRYIGLTSQKPTKRWKNGFGYSKNIIFFSAIKKYGWKNFEHIIIEDNINSLEQAKLREQYWISYYHTYIKDPLCNGYNTTIGGEGTIGYKFTEQQKQNLSKAKKGKPLLKLRGQKQSIEHIEKVRSKLLGKKQSKESVLKRALANTGKKRTAEQKRHIGIANGKAIICIETQEHFYSITEASRQTGLTRQYLMQLLKTAQPCSARILNKYSEELKQKIKYYNGKHFSLIG